MIKSKELFLRILNNYPDTDFAIDAPFKLDLINDINIVKVEFNSNMLAKEFYRKPKNTDITSAFKHYGIYAFTPIILNEVCNLSPTPNELNYKLGAIQDNDRGWWTSFSKWRTF